MNWTAPTLVTINMDAEIGSYQEDGEPTREPPFTSNGASARDRASYDARRCQNKGAPRSIGEGSYVVGKLEAWIDGDVPLEVNGELLVAGPGLG
jgi:hypothetical protein